MGCGTHHEPGWINADGADGAPYRIQLRVGEPLGFATDSLEVVFSEHFLEHITLPEARWFFRESFRVLKPNGLFRVSCPDMDAVTSGDTWRELAKVYESIGDFPPNTLTRKDLVVNHAFYGHGHKHLWTLEALREELEAVGFRDVERMPFGKSRVPGAAIEIRQGEAFMSLIVEATKPAGEHTA
jgi:predicted SAM-dependent methyltransferase